MTRHELFVMKANKIKDELIKLIKELEANEEEYTVREYMLNKNDKKD